MGVSISSDPLLQEELASLILNDRGFAGKFHKHVTEDADLKKKKIQVFTNLHIDRIITLVYDLYKKADDNFPSDGIVCSEIERLQLSKQERESVRELYLKLKHKKIILTKDYEAHLKELLIIAKVSVFCEAVMKDAREPTNAKLLSLASLAKKFVSNIDDISFSSSDLISMDSFVDIIEEYADSSAANIPLGIPELDRELNGGGEGGGAARQEIVAWISGTNDGKSIALGSITSNAVRSGFKVRTFAFEGRKLQTPIRIISNLAQLSAKKIANYRSFRARTPDGNMSGWFSADEIKKIEDAQELYGKMFKVIHAIKSSEIENVEAAAIEEYKKEPYDVLIIDYGQLVESIKTFHKEHELLMYVFRRLEKLAAQLNVAIHVAMQVNRDGLRDLAEEVKDGEDFPTYKMSHVAGGYGTLKTAGCVIAISRTQIERNLGQARFTILKQREGIVGVEVGIKAKFDQANMTEGERYRYFHPIEAAMGASTDLFSKPNPTLNKIENSIKSEVGAETFDLQKAISSNPYLKQLSNIGDVGMAKDIISVLTEMYNNQNKVSELQDTLKQASEGRLEIDPEERTELEKELSSVRKFKETMMGSDPWVFDYGRYISSLIPFIKQLDRVVNSEAYKALKENSSEEFEHLNNLFKIMGLVKLLKLIEVE